MTNVLGGGGGLSGEMKESAEGWEGDPRCTTPGGHERRSGTPCWMTRGTIERDGEEEEARLSTGVIKGRVLSVLGDGRRGLEGIASGTPQRT